MNIEEIREYCLSKQQVTESFPFDEDTLVFKVAGKIFLLTSLAEHTLNLKCKPEKAIALREQYPFVKPGWHMNKIYWNTVDLKEMIPAELLCEWIDDSYSEVIAKLPKKIRDTFSQ